MHISGTGSLLIEICVLLPARFKRFDHFALSIIECLVGCISYIYARGLTLIVEGTVDNFPGTISINNIWECVESPLTWGKLSPYRAGGRFCTPVHKQRLHLCTFLWLEKRISKQDYLLKPCGWLLHHVPSNVILAFYEILAIPTPLAYSFLSICPS